MRVKLRDQVAFQATRRLHHDQRRTERVQHLDELLDPRAGIWIRAQRPSGTHAYIELRLTDINTNKDV